jgi:hypothetical protein
MEPASCRKNTARLVSKPGKGHAWNELDTLKQERTREVKNKAMAKTHRGNNMSTALPCFGVSMYFL